MIEGGRYEAGDRLPSEAELTAAFGVSRATIREVLRSLETAGLVRRVHGVGTFVTKDRPPISSHFDLDLGVTEAVASQARLTIQVLKASRERAQVAVARELGLAFGSEVLWVERVIRGDDLPAAHAVDVMPWWVIERAGGPRYGGGSVYRFLEESCGVALAGGVATVTAVNATDELARLLEVQPGWALLRMEQVERSVEERAVLYSCEHYVPAVFSLTVRRSRRSLGGAPSRSGDGARKRKRRGRREGDEHRPELSS